MTSHPSPYKSQRGMRRIVNAFKYSARGFRAAFEHEAAFRQELLLLALLVPVALWLGNNLAERALLIGALFFVLIIELLNSAIEALADAVTLEHHPLIGRAKDLGSAAVMLSIVLVISIWITVGVNHFLNF